MDVTILTLNTIYNIYHTEGRWLVIKHFHFHFAVEVIIRAFLEVNVSFFFFFYCDSNY